MNSSVIKSPFADCEARLMHEEREVVFRGDTYRYLAQFYRCDETGLDFTTDELDQSNTEQVYNQYRSRFGIPSPESIKALRLKCGLSASKMSELLGFGINQYRLYENGDVPSLSHGRLLKNIQNLNVLKEFISNAKDIFSQEEYNKVLRRISPAIHVEYVKPSNITKHIWNLVPAQGQEFSFKVNRYEKKYCTV